ncbi:carboxypeptidase-like regulatory domain-containing protein [Muribaculum sp. NM65_B17]|uniref:carboxypeptidase-like regulatory domain-containing protein n=1 Tax=Muribaculum sp. NM65_B17 TaxID=2516961 RepID=UPI00109351EE|nr:carboxypeptidase-like regulatory domain-containing protein [Muribaculum sp. NM65_B17]MDE6464714.1 carboxypeptidase-like regulatory domain-containing protein [Muribaculaceae bacterium]TGY04568.1 carboxypeptidase-like regulatory domain-containing protein [Muribaculum sp. NM65_B17]THG44111.1 carboxypeptidase-like regulatory domain-containing protein [Muribaculaceae bacterium]
MKYYIILLSIISICYGVVSAKTSISVVDKNDNSPLAGATVIDKYGIIIGITDDDGCISVDNQGDMQITIRYMGYKPVTISPTDTIKLSPATYELSEVIIQPIERPIKRILCFAREYSSGIAGSDTMQYYCEYMAEAFVADGKVKGYKSFDARPTAKGYKRYARISKNGNDSIFIPKYDDDIAELSWYDFMAFVPTDKIVYPEAIKAGEETDTIYGKYGPQFVFKRKNNIFTKTADVLSNHKNRKWSPFIFKLIGMTVDIDNGTWNLTFADNGSNSVGIQDFISGTYNIHLVGKGKWIKKIFNTTHPIDMNSYLELYPVDLTNCTIDEYKEFQKDYGRLSFQYPKDLQPISPAVSRLVKAIEDKYLIEN